MSGTRDKVWAPLLGAEGQTGSITEILLARHPQVEANLSGVFVGSGESPYTELGARQAVSLAASIAAWTPSSVHASPRTRARAVGEDAARIAGVDFRVDDGLAEIDFGAAEGLTYDEAKLRGVEIDLLGGPPESAPFKDGETWHAFAYRVGDAAARIETAGPRIAVVAHGGVVRALLTHWLRLDHRAAWRFAVGNASISTLTIADGHGTLKTFGIEPGRCAWEDGTR
ncbi:MAG: histidine phosphatase family protein [Coriobacteriia bacterium]|nr:histidine phosphatase family protein [Coriobacteriia bacterium]